MSHTLPFDTQLSRQVDTARAALERAEQAGDNVRAAYARRWLSLLEEKITTDGDDAD